MPLFSSASVSCSFVVGVGLGGVLIYKIKTKKRVFGVFQGALFSGCFFKVVVLYNEKRLVGFLLGLEKFDNFRIEIIE